MAPEEKKAVEEQKATMSTKKLIIIIAGVLIVNLTLIAGVVVYLGGKPASAGGAESTKAAHDDKKLPPAIYPLEPFIVNVYDGPTIRYLKVKLEMQMPTPETKAELDPYLAPMRDAILTHLSSLTMDGIKDVEGKNRLRVELLATVQKIVPQGKISQIYFTDFVTQ